MDAKKMMFYCLRGFRAWRGAGGDLSPSRWRHRHCDALQLNIANILTQISINTVISVGMTFVILLGGIDLSVGSCWRWL